MTTQIAVRLPDQMVAELDRVIEQQLGPTNRTELVREAIGNYLSVLEKRLIDAALIASYAAEPDTVDAWGDLGDVADGEAAGNTRALDGWDGGW